MRRFTVFPGGRRHSCAGVLVVAAIALGGCSGDGDDGSPVAADGPRAAGKVVTTPSSAPTEPAPTGTVQPPLPNPVASVTKVPRPGVSGPPKVKSSPVGYTQAVAYPDGVRLKIVELDKGVEKGNGPGVMTGREYVRFTVRLTNGSSKPIDLNQVVVTTFYGSSRQLAAPVYTEGVNSRDFTGTVKPRASTEAVYAFAVPTANLSDVTMAIDFDGIHSVATYRGKVPVT